ncbi:hypothetical protein J6590_074127 [Homalodisca vitripennis]|nr:hypothetical protein J6590_074127 [Homalodisca vitripennis]
MAEEEVFRDLFWYILHFYGQESNSVTLVNARYETSQVFSTTTNMFETSLFIHSLMLGNDDGTLTRRQEFFGHLPLPDIGVDEATFTLSPSDYEDCHILLFQLTSGDTTGNPELAIIASDICSILLSNKQQRAGQSDATR